MTRPDDDLRRVFAPLRADTPTRDELAAARAATARGPAPVRRRLLPALAAATAVLLVALALRPGDGGDRPAGSALLDAAAAAERTRVPAAATAPLRYVQVRRTLRFGVRRDGRTASRHVVQDVESWVGERWRGRSRAAAGREWTTGDGRLAARTWRPGEGVLLDPRDEPFAYGDGPLADLDPAELPAERDAMGRTLRDGLRAGRWSPYGRAVRAGRTRDDSLATDAMVRLLVHARLTPAQRAALLETLAASPAARDLGRVRDARGRTGDGVELAYRGAQYLQGAERYRLVVDRRTAEVLQWSFTPGAVRTGLPATTETVLRAGYATAVGRRPRGG